MRGEGRALAFRATLGRERPPASCSRTLSQKNAPAILDRPAYSRTGHRRGQASRVERHYIDFVTAYEARKTSLVDVHRFAPREPADVVASEHRT